MAAAERPVHTLDTSGSAQERVGCLAPNCCPLIAQQGP